MFVFKPRLALVYAVAFVIIALVSNRMTISNSLALASLSDSDISTLVEDFK